MDRKVYRRRCFSVMRVTITVWPGGFVGDMKSLAARAVAPCCAASRCGRFKEILLPFTEVIRDLQTRSRLLPSPFTGAAWDSRLGRRHAADEHSSSRKWVVYHLVVAL